MHSFAGYPQLQIQGIQIFLLLNTFFRANYLWFSVEVCFLTMLFVLITCLSNW